jgi:gliding motility-associated-like protein
MNFIKNKLLLRTLNIFIIILCNISFGQTFPNPATLSTGQGLPGNIDPIWLVSQLYITNPPNPLGLTYSPALINNNCAPGSWVTPSSLSPPINNGNWITENGVPCGNNTGGYIYFRLQLNLPSTCNGSNIAQNGNYTLYLSGYVDNIITDVFVNGVTQGISGGNYIPGGQLNMTLNNSWKSGLNYVDIQVFNMPGGSSGNPYGLLMVADYSASLNSDLDGDGIADLNDTCPCQFGGLPDGCCTTSIPTASSTQTFCNSATISNLIVSGTNIQWYNSSTGGSALASTTPLVNGTTYYATQTISGCESSVRLPVIVNISSSASPSGLSTQTFCNNSASIANLTVTGSNIQWYNLAVGGSLIPNTTPLVNGTTYYASQKIGVCESLTRFPINVIIKTPSSPTGNLNQLFCNSATIANLSITGQNIRWYSSATGGTTLSNSTTLINGSSYYSSQIINGCESLIRTPVLVTVFSVPIPIGNSTQEFCKIDNPRISNLMPNQSNIQWYIDLVSSSALNSNTGLIDNTTYYAETTDLTSGCKSPRTKVHITFVPCLLEINNILTLNGNDLNDFISIKNIETFPKNEFQIFNRYGQLLWKGINYDNLHNTFIGKANVQDVYQHNEFLPTGTYFYVLTYHDLYHDKNSDLRGFLYINNNQ